MVNESPEELENGEENIKEDSGEEEVDLGPQAEPEAEPEEEPVKELITGINGLSVSDVPDDLMAGPTSISGQIEILLRNGYMREEIIDVGFSKRSVETIASKLKSRYGKEFGKPAPAALMKADPAVNMARAAKGNDMAQIMQAIKFPEGNSADIQKGVTFGIGILLLGVRLVQEMSTIGIQQTKPLLDVARSMREGETAAALRGAEAAGMAAAMGVTQQIGPELEAIRARQDAMSAPQLSPNNPMADMMAKVMMPHMQSAMQKVMSGMMSGGGGMFGGGKPSSQPALQAPQANYQPTQPIAEEQSPSDGWAMIDE